MDGIIKSAIVLVVWLVISAFIVARVADSDQPYPYWIWLGLGLGIPGGILVVGIVAVLVRRAYQRWSTRKLTNWQVLSGSALPDPPLDGKVEFGEPVYMPADNCDMVAVYIGGIPIGALADMQDEHGVWVPTTVLAAWQNGTVCGCLDDTLEQTKRAVRMRVMQARKHATAQKVGEIAA